MILRDSSSQQTHPHRITGGTYLKDQGKVKEVVGRIPPSPLKIFVLPENVETQLNLEFDIKPPDPSETFFLDIEGLFLNDERYLVPQIRFEPAFFSGAAR